MKRRMRIKRYMLHLKHDDIKVSGSNCRIATRLVASLEWINGYDKLSARCAYAYDRYWRTDLSKSTIRKS